MGRIFDVIIIGGGHAGTEAAAAAARIGAKTCLLSKSIHNLGELSCNPSIGGVAKGIIVREIDALDGVMPRVIDNSGIHFKMLNSSKGPAVWGPRAQADRKLYKKHMQELLLSYDNLTFIEGEVTELILDKKSIKGVRIGEKEIFAPSVVITTGTFLNGVIHVGHKKMAAGRVHETPSILLAQQIKQIGLGVKRLKTGTPARIKSNSISWSMLEEQRGDEIPTPFSDFTESITVPQISCFIGYTTAKTHEIIRENLHLSPMYSGQIQSVGPRYCPSIEDKVVRFAEKERHQIFLEPEGLNDDLVYPNGISTSLPEEVQIAIIHSIIGLEKAEITRFGYAIEYDYIDPTQLYPTLETKLIKGLFLAGQINGTTGYEEAAGQGVIAGVNAVLSIDGKSYAHNRFDSYIGVMISDLTTNGTVEPYRMMTSRAEHRLLLRPDNADVRLSEAAYRIGLLSESRYGIYKSQADIFRELQMKLTDKVYTPNQLAEFGVILSKDGVKRSLLELLSQPNFSVGQLLSITPEISTYPRKVLEKLKIESLYQPFKERYQQDLELYNAESEVLIPEEFDYTNIASLSNEVKNKLLQFKPRNIAEAKRIQGITPAAIVAIQIHMKKYAVN